MSKIPDAGYLGSSRIPVPPDYTLRTATHTESPVSSEILAPTWASPTNSTFPTRILAQGYLKTGPMLYDTHSPH
jgi:hypothetical protein